MNKQVLTMLVLLCFSFEVLASSRLCPMMIKSQSVNSQMIKSQQITSTLIESESIEGSSVSTESNVDMDSDMEMEHMPCHEAGSDSSVVEYKKTNCCNGDLSCKNGYCSMSAMALSLPQVLAIAKQSISSDISSFLPSNIFSNDIRPPISV